MRIVREQMLCIIVPQWLDGEAGLIDDNTRAGLDTLLSAVGVVHYATLALLPALPGESTQAPPSLMLELAVDEGLRPTDLIELLVHRDEGVLWSLFWEQAPPSVKQLPEGGKKVWLQRFLMERTHVADGAFVGLRDRNLKQIEQEAELLRDTLAQRALIAPREDRESSAHAFSRWAFRQSKFEWAAEAAPRSYWRGAAASTGAKVNFALGIVFLTCLALAAAYGVAHGSALVLPEPASVVFRVVAQCLLATIEAIVNAVALAFIAGIGMALLFVALPAVLPQVRRSLVALNDALDRPTSSPFGVALYTIVALYLPIVFGVLVLGGWTIVQWPLQALPPAWVGALPFDVSLGDAWRAVVVGALALELLAAFYGELFIDLPKRAPGWRRTLRAVGEAIDRPRQIEVPRAQQVDPSIDRCEAGRLDGTSHMISLTEIRRPYAWNRFWLRFFLRLVTLVGRLGYTEGRLGEAPGIKFGHWHIVDRGRRLLFCSNYDGAFGGYLDDFIHGASSGLNAFWRFTEVRPRPRALAAHAGHPEVRHARRFPPTRFVFWRGVKCEQAFKTYARDSMLPHLHHFEACNRTMDEVDRATRLRDALFGPRTSAKDDQIMRVLES